MAPWVTDHLARQFPEIPRPEKIFETSSGSTSRDLDGSSSRDLGVWRSSDEYQEMKRSPKTKQLDLDGDPDFFYEFGVIFLNFVSESLDFNWHFSVGLCQKLTNGVFDDIIRLLKCMVQDPLMGPIDGDPNFKFLDPDYWNF